MTKPKLLTDEEMLQRIQDICDRVHAGLLPTDGAGGIVNLINTQKRLYAEMVVGDDRNIFGVPDIEIINTDGKYQKDSPIKAYWENKLRKEQRARIK